MITLVSSWRGTEEDLQGSGEVEDTNHFSTAFAPYPFKNGNRLLMSPTLNQGNTFIKFCKEVDVICHQSERGKGKKNDRA